jgi:TRAP-type transport system periplasmic protein
MMTNSTLRAARFGRRSVLLAGAGAAALALPMTGRRARAATTIRLAVGDPISSSVGVAAEKFAELAAARANGEVDVQVFPDGVLFGGDQNAAVNQLGNGTLQAVILSTNVFASFEPRMNAMSFPYLFSDYDEMLRYMAGEPGQTLLTSLDRLNVEGLAMMLRTFRHVTTRETPITGPDDFEGLKLRVPNNQLFVSFFQAVGANPTPMAFVEVYTALQLGAIDGQENPVEVPLANRFYEVQNHLNLTGHIGDGYILAFNRDSWNGLSAEIQEALREAAAETAGFKAEYDIAEEQKVIAELEGHGMEVHELDPASKQELQRIAQELYPQFTELAGGEEFVRQSLDFLGRSPS